MVRLNGRAIGTWSLRIDAIYCAILGVFVAVSAPQISQVLALPVALIFATGSIVTIWAALVFLMVQRMQLTLALRLVLGVNVLATLLIIAASAAATEAPIALAVLAIAFDVALFAASQLIALRAMDRAAA